MKRINTRNLKKGQIILVGDIGKGKFEVAEVREVSVHFDNWTKIDMDKGILVNSGGAIINNKDKDGNVTEGCMLVLDSEEIKEVETIKNKIKMLENLKEGN